MEWGKFGGFTPKNWDKNLAAHLKIAISECIEKNFFFKKVVFNYIDINNSITIHLRCKQYKIRFSEGSIFGGYIENQLQCNYFLSEKSKVDNAFKRQIKNALEQLPQNSNKHLFIELLPTMNLEKTMKLIEQMSSIESNTKITLCQQGYFTEWKK